MGNVATSTATTTTDDDWEDVEPVLGPDGRRYLDLNDDGQMQPADTLVCRTFRGPPPYADALVVHLDGDFANDDAENLEWSAPLVRSKAPPDRVQADWHAFYWSETASFDGKTLQECVDAYGVGGWVSRAKNMVAALVFLSAERSAANSFLLALKPRTKNHAHAPVTAHERDPQVLKVSPRHGLGARLRAQLIAATFADTDAELGA